MSGSYKEKFDLSGKVAIVTGASKGIGEGTARALAEFGAKVVVSSRKQEAVNEVATSIGEQAARRSGWRVTWATSNNSINWSPERWKPLAGWTSW